MGAKHDAEVTQARIEARRAELHARIAVLKATWRERINPRVLVATGAALGFVLERVVTYRQHKPVIYNVDRRKRHKVKQGKSALVRLLPFAQLAATRWLADRAERPDEPQDQSPRSMSRAASSTPRRVNGLSRH